MPNTSDVTLSTEEQTYLEVHGVPECFMCGTYDSGYKDPERDKGRLLMRLCHI